MIPTLYEPYIEKTKIEAGTRVLPMSDEVYEAFKIRGCAERNGANEEDRRGV